MRPHVICHMGASLDGRIVPHAWPASVMAGITDVYEQLHSQFAADAWIVGRVTMAEFGKGEPRPATAEAPIPRTTWKAPHATKGPYAIAIDEGGKLHLNISAANGDPLVAVLVEAVSDDHLAELRRDGISYLFAGQSRLELPLALEKLNAEFGIARLLLEGGGGINGSFLAAGLVDEISLLLLPVADGNPGPTLFDRAAGAGRALSLTSVDRLAGDVLHLRYRVL